MSSITPSIIIAAWVSGVQARNETVIHGWRPEPEGRGTWSILWSCLATIFICTWSALHLDVPKRHGRWYLLFRKLRWMLIAAAAPELTLARSAENFFEARDFLKDLRHRGDREWTLTHLQFGWADGFCTRLPEGEIRCDIWELTTLIKNKTISGPPVREEELRARGKGDLVVKLVAVLQIIWFVVQTLFRAIQHYQVMALEIMTVAFVFCTVFTYSFSWNQPQDVEYPVVLEISPIRNVVPVSDGTTPEQNLDRLSDAKDDADTQTRRPEQVESNTYVQGWLLKHIASILLGIFACGFGALHCLAWNSPFPTPKERLAWRVCSVATTVLPGLLTPIVEKWNTPGDPLFIPLVLISVLYIIGRATIIVLAFMALRALPADAYQTVNWNNYIPHFAA